MRFTKLACKGSKKYLYTQVRAHIFVKKCHLSEKFLIFGFSISVFKKIFVPLHAILCAYMKILLVITVVAAAVLLLSVGVIFRSDHAFRSQHITENERMKENNIHCATSQDRELRRENKNKIETKKL